MELDSIIMTRSLPIENTSAPEQTLKFKLRYWLHCVKDYYGYSRKYTERSLVGNIFATFKFIFSPEKKILFYPEYPERGMVDYRLTVLLGYAVSSQLNKPYDVAFKRKDSTFFDPEELRQIDCEQDKIINAKSIDISKYNVGQKFKDIFGYALDVEPTEYHGKIVDKSDENAAHDGCVVEGPMKPESVREGRVYQKAIDNTWNKPGYVLDHRVPVHGDNIPLVYLKYRKELQRFSNTNDEVELVTPESVFSDDEIEKIILLARAMGIDFGEFDILRDKDKRIYVVDINNTPFGPPNGLPEKDCDKALALMAKSFKVLIDKATL